MMPTHGQVAADVEAGPGGAARTRLTTNYHNAVTATISATAGPSTTDPSEPAS